MRIQVSPRPFPMYFQDDACLLALIPLFIPKQLPFLCHRVTYFSSVNNSSFLKKEDPVSTKYFLPLVILPTSKAAWRKPPSPQRKLGNHLQSNSLLRLHTFHMIEICLVSNLNSESDVGKVPKSPISRNSFSDPSCSLLFTLPNAIFASIKHSYIIYCVNQYTFETEKGFRD